MSSRLLKCPAVAQTLTAALLAVLEARASGRSVHSAALTGARGRLPARRHDEREPVQEGGGQQPGGHRGAVRAGNAPHLPVRRPAGQRLPHQTSRRRGALTLSAWPCAAFSAALGLLPCHHNVPSSWAHWAPCCWSGAWQLRRQCRGGCPAHAACCDKRPDAASFSAGAQCYAAFFGQPVGQSCRSHPDACYVLRRTHATSWAMGTTSRTCTSKAAMRCPWRLQMTPCSFSWGIIVVWAASPPLSATSDPKHPCSTRHPAFHASSGICDCWSAHMRIRSCQRWLCCLFKRAGVGPWCASILVLSGLSALRAAIRVCDLHIDRAVHCVAVGNFEQPEALTNVPARPKQELCRFTLQSV